LALVQGYKPTILPPVDVPYLTGHALLACSGNEAAVLLIAGGTKGALAVISAIKAGLDISKCVVGEHNTTQATAGRAEAAEYCAASGGTVTSVVDNRTYCAVPEGNP
jgi:putative hemolysin